MPQTNAVPMFDPTGNVRMIPGDQVDAALKAGGKKALKMKDPSGTPRWVPEDQKDAALKAGGTLADTPSTPAGWKTKLDAMFAPETEAGSGVWGRVRAAVMGPLGTLEQTVLHPGDTVKGMGAAAMAGSTPYGTPLYSHTGYKDADEKNERVYTQVGQGVVDDARDALKDHPVYTASSIITPLLLGEGAKALRGERPTGGAPGGDSGLRPRSRLRNFVQELPVVDAGEDFQTKVVDKYGKDAEATRRVNANRQERNAGKLKKHVEAVRKVQEANRIAAKAHADAVAQAVEKNRSTIEKHQNAVQVHQFGEDQAAAQHERAVAEHAAKQKAAAETERVRQETMQKHEQLSAEQARAYDAAEAKAKAENDENWNNWRKKVANARADMASVVDTVRAQMKKLVGDSTGQSEFRQILSETKPGYEDLSEVQQLRNDVAKGHGYGADYTQLTPQQQEVVNRTVEKLGLDVDDEEGEGLKTMPASRLHGIKTQLERAVRNTANGNVRYAVGKVLDAVRAKEEEVSAASGATAELDKARASHGPYVDTFRNSPNEPQTVSSKSRAENSPEYEREQARLRRLEMLGRYDPSIPQRAEQIRSLDQTLRGLDTQTQTAATAGEPPAPPTVDAKPKMGALTEIPQAPTPKAAPAEPTLIGPKEEPEAPDLTAKTREQLVRGLKKFGRPGAWVLRLIAGGLAAHLAHGDLSTFSGDLLIGQTAVSLLTKVLRSESTLRWLSAPTTDTLALIDRLPPEDAAKMRSALTVMALDEAHRGVKGRIDPKMAAFLGPTNVKLITAATGAAVPQTAGEAKRRVAAAQAASATANP